MRQTDKHPVDMAEKAKAVLQGVAREPRHGVRDRGWARLRAEIEPRPERRRRPYAFAAAAAAGVAAAVALSLAPGHEPPSTPPLLIPIAASGEVQIDGEPWITGASTGRSIVLGGGAQLSAQIGERARIELVGPARLELRSIGADGSVELLLVQGVLRSEVTPNPLAPYVVLSGDHRVEVVGTVFTVEARGAKLKVSVSEGRIRVRGPGAGATLEAPSQRTFPERAARSAASSTLEEASVAERRPPAAASTAERLPAPVLTAERPPAPAPAAERPPAPPSEAERPPATVSGPERPRAAPTGPSVRLRRKRSARSPAQAESLSSNLKPVEAPESRPPTDTDGTTPTERARALIGEGRALLAEGKIAEAVQKAEAVLRSAPGRSLEVRAQLILLEVAIVKGDSRAAGRLASSLLAEKAVDMAPEMRIELRYWRGEMARQAGDCDRGLDDLRVVSGAEHSRSEDALWAVVWCRLHLGEDEEAEIQIRRYLARFPDGRFADEARAWLGVK